MVKKNWLKVKKRQTKMRPENRAHRLVLIYSATATAVVVVGITAIAEAAAEEQDYDKDDNPRSSAAAVVTTATHDRTSLRFSKSYYEKRRKVLQSNYDAAADGNILPGDIRTAGKEKYGFSNIICGAEFAERHFLHPVSYTHLTLPTICSV